MDIEEIANYDYYFYMLVIDIMPLMFPTTSNATRLMMEPRRDV